MKVLQGIAEIAGQTALTAHGLREIGIDAHAYFLPHPFGYHLGPDSAPTGKSRFVRTLQRVAALARFSANYDVFHFHSVTTFLPDRLRQLDARLLQWIGRKVVVEFWGSDVRLPSIERARNPFYVNSYSERDEVNRARLEHWAELTNGHVIISDHSFDPFLRPYFPHIHVVGQRIDTQRISARYPDAQNTVPVVVHAPSQREAKGTKYVHQAIERLKKGGLRFEYVEVHGRTQAEALEIYQRADIIVDQLCMGSHGIFALEAMSLGKPVICYILPELESLYPDGFPIINANPHTLEEVLEEWIQQPEERRRRGVASRAYAERVHDCRVVAEKLVRVYDSL